MKLIVGLGNTGDKYAGTRHNLGFMVVDELARRHNLKFSEKSAHKARIAEGQIDGHKVVLAEPTTMMNLSGQAVSKLAHYYKLEPTDVWVVHDELDLEFGSLRIREGSGSAGHNGVASVIEAVGPHCIRWRIGVGRPAGHMDSAAYVLQDFNKDEQKHLAEIVAKTADAIEHALKYGNQDTTHQLLARD